MGKEDEKQELLTEEIEKSGQLIVGGKKRIQILSIIGEIEGHECLPSTSKTTKYEHVIPMLAALEDSW